MKNDLSNAEVLSKLERISPGFQAWASGLANKQNEKGLVGIWVRAAIEVRPWQWPTNPDGEYDFAIDGKE